MLKTTTNSTARRRRYRAGVASRPEPQPFPVARYLNQNGPRAPLRNKKLLTRWKLLFGIGLTVLVGYYVYILLGIGVKAHKQQSNPPLKRTHYPPTDVMISVVLMNYARPGLLRRSSLLPTLLNHPSVAEVLLCHSNPRTIFHYDHPKLHNINATLWNNEKGLALRFYACATTAQHDWVLHVDDDMELDDSAVNELILAMIEGPKRLIGNYARAYNFWKAPHRHGYQYATTLFGSHLEVILTKIVIMERDVCVEFVKRMSLMADIVATSRPLWNGEDIFASLVANQYYGRQDNYAIADLHVWEADNALKDDDAGEADISANLDRHPFHLRSLSDFLSSRWRAYCHAYYRGFFWAIAKARLKAMQEINEIESQTNRDSNATYFSPSDARMIA